MMTFAYKEITISGAAAGVEGTAKLIQEIKDVMVNNMGWTLTEDRSNQPGTSHHVVLQSTGEAGTGGTFYVILASGSGTPAVLQNAIGVRAATAWNTATHTVASSGVANPPASGTVLLGTSPKATFTGWVSGDKDSVVLVSKSSDTVYDGVYVGRIMPFTSATFDPFPVYVVGDATSGTNSVDTLSSPASSQVHTFLSGNTTLLASASDADFESFYNNPLDSAEAPTNIFGFTEGYVAMPNVAGVSKATPTFRSIRGFSTNLWTTAGRNFTGSTISNEDELVSGDGKVYKLFFNTTASNFTLVIRKS